MLYNHHDHSSTECFNLPKLNIRLQETITFHFPLPPVLGMYTLLSVFISLIILSSSYKWKYSICLFVINLFHKANTFKSVFIHFVAYVRISTLFTAELNSTVCNRPPFIYPLVVNDHLACLYLLAFEIMLLWTCVSKYLWVFAFCWITGNSFLNFFGNNYTLFHSSCMIYITTHSAQNISFNISSPTSVILCYCFILNSNCSNGCELAK